MNQKELDVVIENHYKWISVPRHDERGIRILFN